MEMILITNLTRLRVDAFDPRAWTTLQQRAKGLLRGLSIWRSVPAKALLIVVLLAMFQHGSVNAAPVTIVNAPDRYIPGESFAFQVILPEMTQLASYQIDVLLSSVEGTVGSSYRFGSVAAGSPGAGYVFPSTIFFGSGTNVDDSQTERLSLSDLDLSGVDVANPSNDRIATVNVLTVPEFSGTIQLSIDANALILDGPQLTPTPVAEFTEIRDATRAQPPVEVSAVPEPSGLLILVAGFTAVAVRRKRRSVAG